MGKQQSIPSFGATVEEVDANIAAMNAEREAIASKQGTKDFDNKRFEQLSNDLVAANKHRASISPSETGTPQPFNLDYARVENKDAFGSETFDAAGNRIGSTGSSSPEETQGYRNAWAEAQKNNPGGTFSFQGKIYDEATGRFKQSEPGPAGNPLSEQQIANFTDPNRAGGTNPLTGQPNDVSLLGTETQIPTAGEIIPPENSGNKIVQDVLAGIDRTKNDGIGSTINKSMFGQPGGYKPDPIVDITAEDIFQGVNDPILKGTVSGSFMGNQPIFVGGADYFPTQVLNRRQKAIQDAAIEQKKKEQDFLSQRAPLIKDKGFQQSVNTKFNNEFNSMVDQAKETYGDGWYDAITDQSTDIGRQFVNFSDNMNFIAGSADQTTELIASTRKNMDEGTLVYSDQTMQMLDDYENMQGQFAGGNVDSLVNLREEHGKLQGAISLDTFLNDKNVDVKGTVTGWASVIDNDDHFVTSESKKTAYEAQLRQLAKDWATKPSELSPLVRAGMMTEEDIFNHLQSLYGYDAVVNTKSVTNKPAGSGGITINMEGTGETTEKTQEIDGVTYDVVYSREISTGGKPMDMSGMYSYDANGKLVPSSGVVSVDPNAAQVVKVGVKQSDGSIKYEYKAGFVGTETETIYFDRNGKQTTDKSKAVGSKDIQTDKLYAWDDSVKQRWITDNPNLKEQIEQTDKEIKSTLEKNNGLNIYNKAEQEFEN